MSELRTYDESYPPSLWETPPEEVLKARPSKPPEPAQPPVSQPEPEPEPQVEPPPEPEPAPEPEPPVDGSGGPDAP